jgi:hypothetical protein
MARSSRIAAARSCAICFDLKHGGIRLRIASRCLATKPQAIRTLRERVLALAERLKSFRSFTQSESRRNAEYLLSYREAAM